VRLEELGCVGNCQISALIDATGAVTWCCLPRFDSEPVFSTLLDTKRGGEFRVCGADDTPGTQRYLDNTNVLETVFRDDAGTFRVLDFAPRFVLHDRVFRPTQLFRVIEPLEGTPRVRVSCAPRLGWSKRVPQPLHGSNHVRFEGFAEPLRLTSDIPTSYLGGSAFALTERKHLALTWGPAIEEPLAPLAARFLTETERYWRRWVKHCNIPPLYQAAVIRSALALKLHCFEDTGAIVAAMTTSIPESPGSGRTWDYRYCWLRDAFYTLGALRLLGHFEEREHFLRYLLELVAGAKDLRLAPLYRVDGRSDLDERILFDWPGFEGEKPVRVGNAAATHHQHDIYGELVLALAPIFLDDRFAAERSPDTLRLIAGLARRAVALAGSPDAGIWEYRKAWEPQTFSSLMCWAGADRMATIATRHAPELYTEFSGAAQRIHDEIVRRSWHGGRLSFVSTYGGADLDASLLQAPTLRFLPPQDQRLHQTVDAIRAGLAPSGWLHRYKHDDGLGQTAVAFVICSFWLVEALAALRRHDEARSLMDEIHGQLPRLGLLAEDYAPEQGRMWGNFPQAYSHVGLIHAAFAASPPWSQVL
jgi:GH15 family glucan-1,4-alpha-glucosidase